MTYVHQVDGTSGPGLTTTGLTVSRRGAGPRVTIAEGLDLQVRPGESVAIVGESGSGKSVTARAILGLLPNNLSATGEVGVSGEQFLQMPSARRRAALGSEIAFVMQDPFTMLNPVMRVGDQVTAALRSDNGRPLGRVSRRRQAEVRLAEVGISDPSVADKYPFQLSGGMRQRVAIAAAIAEKPRILVADEPTTALDVSTQKDVLELLDRLRREHDMGLLLITHDLRVAFSTCDRVYVMYAGQVVEEATGEQLRAAPHHPYSAALMAADPPLERRLDRLLAIPGRVPPPGGRPDGCRFAPRCEFAQDVCGSAPVDLAPAGDGHRSRCVRPEIVPLLQRPALEAAPSPPSAVRGDVGEAVVTLREVRKSYGSTAAVRSADLDVMPGESVGVVGESGSGKTTLARMIVGLVRPTSGHVRVGGIEVGHSTTRRELDRVRGTVQMAFQDPHSTLNPSRTVGASLRDGLRLAGEQDVRGRVAELLEMVGLPAEYAARRPAQLSGGERQRVAIARALSRGPQVLVCDEVVSALDVSVQANVLNLLRDLQAQLGLALVFITHDLAVVRQVTDRVYVLCGGEVVESGPTAQVLDAPQHPYTQRLISSIPDATVRSGSAVT